MGELDSVKVEPTPITTGENVTIEYDGLLKESGANEVYLHAGIGTGDEWQDVKTIKMNETPHGACKTTVRLNTTQRFNFCFKDNAEHWDNNNGQNWSYEVHNGQQY
jgi:hypothetical protein